MSAVRPRALVHRGVVEAAGLLIPRGDEDRARRRVLAVWQPGAALHALAGGYAILWPRPTRVDCDRAAGTPLVRAGAVLTAAPFTAAELEALAAPAGELIVVRGGRAERVSLEADTRIDPAVWIDLSGVEIRRPVPVAEPQRAAIPVAVAEPARAVLGGVAAAPPEARDVARALARAARPDDSPARTVAARAGRLRRWLDRIAARLAGQDPGSGRPAPVTGGASGQALARPGRWDRWRARLRARLSRLLLGTRLAERVGRKQAEYLRDMLAMFDRGDLDEALRHAIPLAGGEGPGEPSLSTPKPRDDLAIPLERPAGPGSSLGVIGEAYQLIRDRYRGALARLEAQGRLAEAAFVLCELLGDVEGAIALLERHGDRVTAARLAESRELPPGLQVRLWVLARRWDRAIAVARRTGAFADAVTRLARHHPDRAAALRAAWAENQAAAGDWAGAAEILWPVEPGSERMVTWMERAADAGGTAGARHLARLFAVAPERWERLYPAARDILADDADEGAFVRVELARELTRMHPHNDAIRAMARMAARTVIRDIGRGLNGDAASIVGRLLRIAGDPGLRADRPPLPAPTARPALVDRGTPARFRFDREDAGNAAIHDAALLPSGRVVVALGGLGVRLLTAGGKTITHFEQPAHELCISDNGTRVIAIARRGSRARLARIDLTSRRAEAWGDLELDRWASSFDGERWLVASAGQLLALDATSERPVAMWGVDTGGGFIREVARDPASVVAAIAPPQAVEELEIWRYQLPGLVLLERRPAPLLDRPATAFLRYAARPGDGAQFVLCERTDADDGGAGRPTGELSVDGAVLDRPILIPVIAGDLRGEALVVSNRWCGVIRPRERAVRIDIAHLGTRRVITSLELDGAERAGLRFGELDVTICDDRGRVVGLDLRFGNLRRSLRVRA